MCGFGELPYASLHNHVDKKVRRAHIRRSKFSVLHIGCNENKSARATMMNLYSPRSTFIDCGESNAILKSFEGILDVRIERCKR